MTQVDFYILQQAARDNQYSLACRLTEKAWQQGHRVLICVDTEEEIRHMDRLLWTFREKSFIPHGVLGKVAQQLNPVLISTAKDAADEHDVLINLCAQVPEYFSRFSRVAECVDRDEKQKTSSRERFRFYRDHGYPLKTHEIT